MPARRPFVPPPLPDSDKRPLPVLPSKPLTWWRTLPPSALDLAAQRRLRAALLEAPPPPMSGWAAACRADPAASVGVAFSALAQALVRPEQLDPALSAVALCAALGDPACRDLLAHTLSRRARARADLHALRLARAWGRPIHPRAGRDAGSRH